MLVPNRHGTSDSYRFGWNGQEKVDEIAGEGNHNTAKFWEYDTRTATRWNLDPDGLPFWSPYAVNYGMPIKYTDPDGDCPWFLVAALLLTADIAMAPTNDKADNQRKYDEASRNRTTGLTLDLVLPGVGSLANKYIVKKVVAKSAPVIKKMTTKVLVKKTEEKVVGEVEKKLVQKSGQEGEKKLIQKNAEQGAKFEKEVIEKAKETQTDVVEQITVKTKSGTKTRLDILGNDKSSGEIILTEAKSSATAPLTKNQKIAFPEIEATGATVVGKGKAPFTGGTVIPPTKIEIVRPQN